MKNLLSAIALIIAIAALGIAIGVTLAQRDGAPLGGGLSTYKATTTTATVASETTVWLVKRGQGVLGSVIISSTTADSAYSAGANFVIADSAYSTTTASTTPSISFPRSAAAGTYVFDKAFNAGLLLSIPANFNGVYTITYE